MTKKQLEKILCNFWDATHKAPVPPPKDFELIGKIIKDNSNLLEPPVKPAKNVKDYEWLDKRLDDILSHFKEKRTNVKETKDLLFEFIFEDLINQIQELKDSSLSV